MSAHIVRFTGKARPPAIIAGSGDLVQDAAQWLGRELAELLLRAPYNLSPCHEGAGVFIAETLQRSGVEVLEIDGASAAGKKAFLAAWLGRP